MCTVEERQVHLELALAAAQDAPVRRVVLRHDEPVPIWDFRYTDELIALGYEITRQETVHWAAERPAGWRRWAGRLFSSGPRRSDESRRQVLPRKRSIDDNG